MPNQTKIPVLILGLSLFLMPGIAHTEQTDEVRVAHEAEGAFKEIVSLWKEERYEDLYGYGLRETQNLISKQVFSKLMRESNVRLQCCWTTMNHVSGIAFSQIKATVKATMGYEKFSPVQESSGTGQSQHWNVTSTFKEETFSFKLEDGTWKIDLADILSAGGYGLRDLLLSKGPSSLSNPGH